MGVLHAYAENNSGAITMFGETNCSDHLVIPAKGRGGAAIPTLPPASLH